MTDENLTLEDWKARALDAEKRLQELDAKPVGSHHGDPILTRHDLSLLKAYNAWVYILFEEDQYRNLFLENKNKTLFMPNDIDWLKSRLFWRLRAGKDPLPYPPPTAFSCPWYEIIEVPGPHDSFEHIRVSKEEGRDDRVYIAQCPYKLLEKTDDGKYILGFGPYRFKAWNGPIKRKKTIDGITTEYEDICAWLEYTGIDETDSKAKGKHR